MIIDGKKEAQLLRDEIKKEIELIKLKNNKVPGLTVILIGDFAPSQIYVKNKEKNAKEVGINSEVVRYSKDVSELILFRTSVLIVPSTTAMIPASISGSLPVEGFVIVEDLSMPPFESIIKSCLIIVLFLLVSSSMVPVNIGS